jgi:hypothetical protein
MLHNHSFLVHHMPFTSHFLSSFQAIFLFFMNHALKFKYQPSSLRFETTLLSCVSLEPLKISRLEPQRNAHVFGEFSLLSIK